MIKKRCICTCEEPYRLDYLYRNCNSSIVPEVIYCIERSGGLFETGALKGNEIKGRILCQCGKYMKTHLHKHFHHDKNGNKYGKPKYEITARSNCDNPKPEIMECGENDTIDVLLDNIIKNIEGIRSYIKQGI